MSSTPDDRKFRQWTLQWRPEHVGRYWDWWSRNPALEHLYFSKVYGEALLDEISRTIPLRGTLLDLGSGPGHLIEKALARGVEALAVDQSPEPELEVMCPDCGCVFHQFQHVRSFTPEGLRAAVEARGFKTLRCRPLLLSFLPRWMQPFHRWVYPRVKGKLPHLLYVGQRA